jgi:hypothetical protein
VAEVLDVFQFYPPGSATFGSCEDLDTFCFPQGATGVHRRDCRGAANLDPLGSDFNLPPRVERDFYSTNNPDAGEAVAFTVTVRDEKLRLDSTFEEVTDNIKDVQVVYRVDGADWRIVEMQYDASSEVQSGSRLEEDPDTGELVETGRPLNLWTFWDGSIPGQPAGSRVEFFFRVRDAEQLAAGDDIWSTSPRTLCHDVREELCQGLCAAGGCADRCGGDSECVARCEAECAALCDGGSDMGPCDRDFGGPGCVHEPDDVVVCHDEVLGDRTFIGERYFSCSGPFTYRVAYEPRGDLGSIVINEIVARQSGRFRDWLQSPCSDPSVNCTDPEAADGIRGCCQEDLIEIHNTSGADVDISGIWLSDSPFRPDQRWAFPPGSTVPAGGYIIVWLDNDGGRCPDPRVPLQDQPCFWECPDPTDATRAEFHVNFALDANGDQIFLYDTGEHGFGLIHGLDFTHIQQLEVEEGLCGALCGSDQQCLARCESGRLPPDVPLYISLLPNGDRRGCWQRTIEPTIDQEPSSQPRGRANEGECDSPFFKRGDANDDCNVDLSDGVYVLTFLFNGGPAPVCRDAADANDTAVIDITDAIYIFGFLFLGGPSPPEPGPNVAGIDPTPDELPRCESTCGQ